MKTLRILAAIFLMFGLSSCSNYGKLQDDLTIRTNIEKEFPNAIKIMQPTGERFRFIVLDSDSSLWYVEAMNQYNTNISGKERIFNFYKRVEK